MWNSSSSSLYKQILNEGVLTLPSIRTIIFWNILKIIQINSHSLSSSKPSHNYTNCFFKKTILYEHVADLQENVIGVNVM